MDQPWTTENLEQHTQDTLAFQRELRHKAVVEAGRITTEDLERLGFKGKGGFLGRGVYGSGNRKPGYRRRG